MELKEKLIITLKKAKDILFTTRREKHVQNVLSELLSCRKRYILNTANYVSVEVDLLGDSFGIEVKFDKPFYAGIGQALMLRELFKLQNCVIIHVKKYFDSKFKNSFIDLLNQLEVMGILINQRTKKIFFTYTGDIIE